MATFRQYNIQLLPLDTKTTEEVGAAGYKLLMELFSEYTTNAYKTRTMAAEAKALRNDTFICPFSVHVSEKFAYGQFIKFHKAETVTEFYSQDRLFVAQKGTTAVANTHYFSFMFDFEVHRLGIEEKGGRLPSEATMQETLEHFLEKLAERHFSDYTLTVNLISDERSLREVLAPRNEFGHVWVRITFPNSRRLNDTLRELKSNNTHSIEATVAPARGARMKGLPGYIRELVQSAAELGDAVITFFKPKAGQDGGFSKFTYSTIASPRTFTIRHKKNESSDGFIERAWTILKARAKREEEQPEEH